MFPVTHIAGETVIQQGKSERAVLPVGLDFTIAVDLVSTLNTWI